MKFSFFTRFVFAAAVFLLLSGCSGSDTVITPTDDSSLMSNGSSICGHYQLVLDEEGGSVELINREASFDVTPFFMVRLLDYEWDPVKRLLYATVELENLVDCVFWGVNLVFDNTGGRFIVNSDGYHGLRNDDSSEKPKPFIAYERDTYHREMPGVDAREIIFHVPRYVCRLDFWIDAVQPWEREEPFVEEQFCHQLLKICPPPAWAITAFCYDFQTHYMDSWGDKGINDLEVWADLRAVGGSAHEPMYDDGMHFDYDANDHYYAVVFEPPNHVNFGMIKIYAKDSDGNIAMNKVPFLRHHTLRDYPWHSTPLDTIEKGYWSNVPGPHFEIIRGQRRWHEFWMEHKGGPPCPNPPYVNFAWEMVIVDIAGYGGAEKLNIHHIFENYKGLLEVQTAIWHGTKGCILPTLATNAYHIVKIEKNHLIPDHQVRDRLFYCDEQLAFNIVEDGLFSNIHDSREVIVEDWGSWVDLWNEHTGGMIAPPLIDFDVNTVAAIFLGDREIGDTYVEVDRVMDYQGSLREIYYSEHFPGYGCMLYYLDSQPYSIVVFPKLNWAHYEFVKRWVPDDCI